MIHEKASDLWPALVTQAGLDIPVEGWLRKLLGKRAEKRTSWYDEDLVADLRGVMFPNATGSFEDLLARSDPPVPAEKLLRHFFQALKPFSMMKRDILEMLSAAGARRGEKNLRIRFHFDASDDPLELLLSEFREQMEVIEQRTSTISVASWTTDRLWRLYRIPKDHPDWPQGYRPVGPFDPAGQAIVDWAAEARSTRRFATFPRSFQTGQKDLDTRLGRVVNLLQDMLSAYRRYGSDYAALRRASGQPGARETIDPIGLTVGDLAQIEDDVWSASLGEWLAKVRQVAKTHGPDSSLVTKIISEIDELLPETGEREITELFRNLVDLLNLPVWKKREQVYSVWVGTQIWQALKDHWNFRFHVEDGTLSFAFAGVHLATLTRRDDVLVWWTELMTLANDLPSGHRSRAIKPDYRILRPPFSGPETDVLVVEVKQYMRGGTANFSAALLDYAHACPRAGVLLANYGPVNDNALAAIPLSAKDRVQGFGRVRPDADYAANRQDLQNRIRRIVDDRNPPLAIAPKRIELSWGAVPLDLDLHLFPLTTDGVHVFYETPVHGTTIRLHGDVQTGRGPEVISLEATSGRFLICVHQFSSDGSLTGSGATVKLFADETGSDEVILLQCPTAGRARWWAVCLIDCATGAVRNVGELVEHPHLIDWVARWEDAPPYR